MSAADALLAFVSAMSRISRLPIAQPWSAAGFDAGAAWLVEALLRASVQGVVVAGVIWAICRLAPRMPAGARAGLWWLAGLQLLVGLAWPQPMTLAVLPPQIAAGDARTAHEAGWLTAVATDAATPVVPRATDTRAAGTLATGPRSDARNGHAAAITASAPARAATTAPARPFFSRHTLRIVTIVLAIAWALVALGRLLRLAHMRRQLHRLVARAAEPPAPVQAAFARLCASVAPRQRPSLRVSDEIEIPQVSGARRPVILLPARQAARLSPSELSMTLCHELTHVTRGDLWLGWIPAIARELFFFHPLAALAAREYGVAREAACDAAVIQALDAEPQEYGRLLVTLGVSAPRAARHAPLVAAGSSSSIRLLKRRLVMLQDLADRPHRSRAWWPLTALALVGLVPVQLTGQRPHTVAHGEGSASASAPTAGVAGGVRGGVAGGVGTGAQAAVGGVSGGVPGGVAGDVASAAADGVAIGVAGGVSNAQFLAVAGPGVGAGDGAGSGAGSGAGEGAGRGSGEGSGSGAGDVAGEIITGRLVLGSEEGQKGEPRWVLLRDEHTTSVNGSSRNIDRARSFQKHRDEPLLWIRLDDEEFIVRDTVVLEQMVEAFKPVEELGRRQGELGERQGALGAQQGMLGAQQGRLGAEQGVIGGQQGRTAARRAVAEAQRVEAEVADREGRSEAAQQKMRERERALKAAEEEEQRLAAKQEELSRQQEDLGRQQEALGEKQEELGRQQEALGRQQEEASRRAERIVKELIAKAIASGTAQKVK